MKDLKTLCFAISIAELDQAIALSIEDNTILTCIVTAYNNRQDPVTLIEEVLDKLPINYYDFADVFNRLQADKLLSYCKYNYKIKLLNNSPIRSRLYPISGFKLQKVREYLNNILDKGFIRPSQAAYLLLVLFTIKYNSNLRFYINYRKLNEMTKKNQYLLPLIKEVLARIHSSKYLTRLDVIAAFNKLRMHSNSKDLTTFITSLEAYKYKVLPFGLTNRPASYQQYINDVLFNFLNRFI